jgi:hypothetical protein
MEMVAVNETSPDWEVPPVKWAHDYVSFLRADMEKVSKKWKTYQRKRIRQGKSSPEWAVPAVRMILVDENVGLYLYRGPLSKETL